MPKKQSESPAPDASRETLLREAAALARQGKLDQAVGQYEAALEASPDDWGTANLVGDLWLKLGDTAKAKRHFDSAADRLATEGFHAKASALYKKILKIWPDDENARVRAGQIAEHQELFADSDTHYRAAIALRKARGDIDGAQALEERLRVRPTEGGAAPDGATVAAGAPARAAGAADRWARAQVLTPDQVAELVRQIEIEPSVPRPRAAPAAAYTTESWGGEIVTVVVGALDRVPETIPAAFDAAQCLAALGVDGDAWRALVSPAARPEWIEAALAAEARAQAARAAMLAAMTPAPIDAPEPVADAPAAEMEPLSHAVAPEPLLQLEEPEPAVQAATPVEPEPDTVPVPALASGERPDVDDINVLFEYLRTTFAAAHSMEARGWLARGRSWLATGDAGAGIPALERATSAISVRGEAASVLGRHYLHTGNPAAAVRWLERAAECPAADDQAGQDLVYDIGCALQDLGEDLRALAVFSELSRATGPYRDVSERIDRLSGLA